MTIDAISFVSRAAAESMRFTAETAIISITDPGKRTAHLDAWFSRVLRLSFFDAIPGDEYIPIPIPGCFDRTMAQEILDFLTVLHGGDIAYRLVVHCEQGLSRSAAVALFAAAYAGTPLVERERAWRANTWVVEQLEALIPRLEVEIPVGQTPNDD